MKVLALDTATEACSCAVWVDNQVLYRYALAPRRHADLILPMLTEVLAEAGLKTSDLDAIAFGRGPGSFTGVRIACGVAQGIGFALGKPLLAISTLAALAQAYFQTYPKNSNRYVISAIDARMNEIYWAAYKLNAEGIAEAITKEQVCAVQQVQLPCRAYWDGIGSGWRSAGATHLLEIAQAQSDEIIEIIGMTTEYYPDARAILPLALAALTAEETITAAEASPIYLRDKVVG